MYRVLTDKMEIHIIQIPKFKKQREDIRTKLDLWMEFISQIDKERVKNAMNQNKEIKKAQEEYEYLIGEESERRIAFLREKAIRDEHAIYEGGIKKGEKIGEARGKKLGETIGRKLGKESEKREIAKKLKEEKVPIEIIIKTTGLSKNEIEEL